MIKDPAQSIYLHLPFCKTKCPYCDFASFTSNHQSIRKQYLDCLYNEIDYRLTQKPQNQTIKTIFFGGGTPSIHEPEEIESIINHLKNYFVLDDDIEVTLEANPGTIDHSKLSAMKEIGVNRISLGVQSFNSKILEKLARGHSVEDSHKAIAEIENLNFKSWSIDLIYGLPEQNLDNWEESLSIAIKYKVPHISAYALSIEAGTPFAEIYGSSNHKNLPPTDWVVKMYENANTAFVGAGLKRYEISNWSQSGHEAKHNLVYWRAQEYFAFGVSAHGYIDAKRYANTRDLSEYLKRFSTKKPNQESTFRIDQKDLIEKVSIHEKLREKVMLNLRLTEGLELNNEIEAILDLDYCKQLSQEGFLKQENNQLILTDKALMLSNKILARLLKG